MRASTLHRTIHHATGLAGLAIIAASIWAAWSTCWYRPTCAMSVVTSLFGLYLILCWLRQRHDGHREEIDAEQTLERIASAEQVDDDRSTPQARPESMARAFLARRFLPSPLPSAWSTPVNPVGSPSWHVSAGREKLLLTLTLKGGEPDEVNAYILPARAAARSRSASIGAARSSRS